MNPASSNILVIVRLSSDILAHAFKVRGIEPISKHPSPDGTVELEIPESFRREVRKWFAEDDSVLYFSPAQGDN